MASHIIILEMIQMSKREKLIEKLKNNPNNVKFETILWQFQITNAKITS